MSLFMAKCTYHCAIAAKLIVIIFEIYDGCVTQQFNKVKNQAKLSVFSIKINVSKDMQSCCSAFDHLQLDPTKGKNQQNSSNIPFDNN